MVSVTNEKGETIHQFWDDPWRTALFLLYRYRSQKRQSCHTTYSNTNDINESSSAPCEYDCLHSSNTDPDTKDFFDASATTGYCSNPCSTTATHFNTMSRSEL